MASPAKPKTSPAPADGEPVPVIQGSNVYLIDGSGYIFRAFHALPPLTRPSDGLPVGAVAGFCAMLWKLLAETKLADRPTHIAVIFDAGAVTFRNTIYPDYKAHRPPPPEELIPQFPLIRDAVRAFGVACIEMDGFEADDLIATYARQAEKAGADVLIVSSDKDLMQLVAPGIALLDTMKNRRIGRDEVIEKFGVPPEKVIDVQALAGDSVDNVPGVPGIGVKTGAELIIAYGDLDTLLARAAEIKQPKRREKLIEFADQARVSRQLVTLKDDVPVTEAIETFGVRDPDPAQLLGFLREMEFNTLTRRIAEGLGADIPPPTTPQTRSSIARAGDIPFDIGEAPSADRSAEASVAGRSEAPSSRGGAETPAAAVAFHAAAVRAIPIDRTAYETVTTVAQLEAWVAAAREAGRFAFDTETAGLDPMRARLVGFSLATAPGRACYAPLAHHPAEGGLDFGESIPTPQIPLAEALALLKPLLADKAVLKIGQNIKFDAHVLGQHGIEIAPIDDTLLLSYALDGGPGSHGMDDLALRHLGCTRLSLTHVLEFAAGPKKGVKKSARTFAQVPVDKATEYAAEGADVTLRLWMVLKPRLAAEHVTRVYERLDRPLVPVILAMERDGIKVDRAILAKLSSRFAAEILRLEGEVQRLAGQPFNLGSPKQLGELLFDTLKLPGGKKTKTGQWETRANLLDDLAANDDLPQDSRTLIETMLSWRQLAKLRSTYTESLPEFINPDTARIHTNYALAHTTTGRLSSLDPNLQNIPIRTPEGRAIRTAFVAEAGHNLISADYSQIELRLLAHIADIPQLKKAFADGLDIHAMTASEMFGVPLKDMPPEVRRRAKAINFGIIYGISAFGLANQLGIPRQEAGDYIKTYFARFPGILDYMDATKTAARAQGYVETIFGRRIHYPEINSKNPSARANFERAAINAPIQGSAADIIRRAMIRMPDALAVAGLSRTRMLLQVHDELVFEALEAEVAAAIPVIRHVMIMAPLPAVALAVPLQVDAKSAANWEAAH